MTRKTILTGVKPTGAPHIGNYLGAILPIIETSKNHPDTCLFIADYHALNAVHDPVLLRQDSLQIAACYLALGFEPAHNLLYRQSDIPEIFELATVLAAVTPKGLMDRSHAYKAAVDKNTAEGRDADHGVNMGLYTYPILMASDILIADADIVPVGKDQVQHIEFARDMAGYFNNTFGDTLKLPEYSLSKNGAILPGIDGRKMSKSYDNHIPIFMDSKQRRKLVMKIVTDSKTPAEPKDAESNTIFQLYSHFAPESDIRAMREGFEKGGMGYGDAKQMLFEALEKTFEAPSERYHALLSRPQDIESLLENGAAKMRARAVKTLSRVREACGLKAKTI